MKGGTMESEVDSEAKSLALVGIGECAASHWWLRIVEIAGKHNRNGHQNATWPSELTHIQFWDSLNIQSRLKVGHWTLRQVSLLKGAVKHGFFIGTMTVSVKAQQKASRWLSWLHKWAMSGSADADEWSANQNAHLSPMRVFWKTEVVYYSRSDEDFAVETRN